MTYQEVMAASDAIAAQLQIQPVMGIVLGSGLGSLADEIEDQVEIDYGSIPHFPVSTVVGHSGKLVAGNLYGQPVLAMKGRFHYYEGYDISQVVFHVQVFKRLGIKSLIVTNAAGGVNPAFSPGDLMFITDHISFFAPSPLRGKNMDEIGVRFPDMTEAYSQKLLTIAKNAAQKAQLDCKEGVYAFAQGPMYETPAEIRALSVLGADAVGMSTVPEVIAARHAGMEILGISCITNMAAGILGKPLAHEEVTTTAKRAETRFKTLLKHVIEGML